MGPGSRPAPAPAQAPAPAAAPDVSPSFEAGDTAAMDRDIGPLKDRVPPVTGYTFRMAHRFEFAPNVDFSFRDAFWTKLLVGFTATYHFTETIGLALRADYAITSVSNSAQISSSRAGLLQAQLGAARRQGAGPHELADWPRFGVGAALREDSRSSPRGSPTSTCT